MIIVLRDAFDCYMGYKIIDEIEVDSVEETVCFGIGHDNVLWPKQKGDSHATQ